MFYPLGKNSEKPYGGDVRPRVKKKKKQILKTEDGEKNCIQGTTRYAA